MPQRTIFIALHNDYAEDFTPDTSLPEDRAGIQIVAKLLKGNRGHYGPLEHVSMTLAIRTDHNTVCQLTRHRLFSFDVQSMRYTGSRMSKVATHETPVEEVFYVRPPSDQYTDRQGSKYEWSEEQSYQHYACSLSSAMAYDTERKKGVAEEHARGHLTTNYLQNVIMSGNLRAYLHLLEVRIKPDAQGEFQALMEMVAKELRKWVPEIYEWWHEHRKGKAILAP